MPSESELNNFQNVENVLPIQTFKMKNQLIKFSLVLNFSTQMVTMVTRMVTLYSKLGDKAIKSLRKKN